LLIEPLGPTDVDLIWTSGRRARWLTNDHAPPPSVGRVAEGFSRFMKSGIEPSGGKSNLFSLASATALPICGLARFRLQHRVCGIGGGVLIGRIRGLAHLGGGLSAGVVPSASLRFRDEWQILVNEPSGPAHLLSDTDASIYRSTIGFCRKNPKLTMTKCAR